MVEHLLQHGANVHAKDDGGLVPLHNACSFGHAEAVQLLLRKGADPCAKDNWNYTPLHEAAAKGMSVSDDWDSGTEYGDISSSSPVYSMRIFKEMSQEIISLM